MSLNEYPWQPPATTTRVNPVDERGWFWFLSLICLVIVLSSLGSAALFEPDEGRNAEKAREILLLGDWVTPHQNFLPTLDKPIFFYWLVAISFRLLGLSEWAARLPSALASLGCIFLVYRFARVQWGLWEALWSGLILVTSLEFFLLSRIVIFDMTLTFFIALALFSFYAVTQSDPPGARNLPSLIMYAAMGAGTLVKGPVALLVPGMVIFFYLLFTRKWLLLRQLNLLFGAAVYFAIVAPWYLWVEVRNPGYLYYFLWEEHFVRYLTPHFSRIHTWYYFFLVVAVGFLPWSFLIPLAAKNLWKPTLSDANLFLALWVTVPFLFFSASHSKLPHYILPIYPALTILTGQVAAAKISDPKRARVLYFPGIMILSVAMYLLLGAAWPDLLPSRIRSMATENWPLLAFYGTMISVVFGVFIVGDLRNRWANQNTAFVSTAVALALFFVLTGRLAEAVSVQRTSKSLAQAVVPLIDSGDRVVFYDTYFEGLPFYLRLDKPVWLVQSRRKTEVMGSFYVAERRPAPAAGYGQVLFTFEEFAEQWKKNELSLRVFVKEKNLLRLSSEVGFMPKLLTRFDDTVLVANR